jgi:hypothetical protein
LKKKGVGFTEAQRTLSFGEGRVRRKKTPHLNPLQRRGLKKKGVGFTEAQRTLSFGEGRVRRERQGE